MSDKGSTPIAPSAGVAIGGADFVEERLLAQALEGRGGDEGARAGAEEAWKDLVARNIDRVRGWVRLFRHPQAAQVKIPSQDVVDVAQDAWIRAARRMLWTFEGSDLKTLRAALRTCAFNTCMDWCRAEMNRDKRFAGSLDETLDSEDGSTGDANRYDGVVSDLSREREALRAADEANAQALDDAIARLESEKQRMVLQETRAGYSSAETAQRHGWSADAIDKNRSRGMLKLAEDEQLIEELRNE